MVVRKRRTMNIGLIGAGAYGQAMAMMLLKNNNNVVMWTENEEKYEFYKENSEIKSLINGVKIPQKIKLTNDIKEASLNKDIIFIMTTAHYVGEICDKINPYITKKTIICIASKGIENISCKFLSDIAYEKLKTKHIAIISGPSFAIDMANNYPVGLSIASLSKKTIKLIKQSLVSDSVKLRETTDLIGVQICGSIKNVIALAAGMLDGMNYPESTQSFLITESLNDIKELIKALGGNPKTCLSFAGLGDLLLTCTSTKSRNFKFGKLVGSGASKEIQNKFLEENTVEGYYTLHSVYKLVKKKKIKMPIIDVIYKIIVNNNNPHELVTLLINKK